MAKIKKKVEKLKLGRPTDYRPEYCRKLIEFFDIEPVDERKIDHFDAKGNVVWTDIKMLPQRIPSIRKFAKSIGVHFDTIYEWVKVHKEFSDSFTHAQAIRKELLIDMGMMGLSPPASFKFVAVNMTDMRDQVIVDDGREDVDKVNAARNTVNSRFKRLEDVYGDSGRG